MLPTLAGSGSPGTFWVVAAEGVFFQPFEMPEIKLLHGSSMTFHYTLDTNMQSQTDMKRKREQDVTALLAWHRNKVCPAI